MKKFIKAIIFVLCIILPAGFCFNGCSEQKFADAWTYDENYHWHASLDENSTEVQFKGEHIMSDWIDNTDANPEDSQRYKKCEICDYKIYESLASSEGLQLEYYNYSDSGYYVKGIGTCTDTTIRIPEIYNGEPVIMLDSNCFKGETNIKCVVIPDSIIETKTGAFENCTSLERVIVGKNNCFDGGSLNGIFSGCTSLKNIVIDESNEYYKSIDGNVYSKNGKAMIYYACGKTEQSFTVLDTVETIEESCFENCKLKSITVSDSVKTINAHAFSDCTQLESIVLGNSVETIEGYAFLRSAIKSITIPASVTSLGWACFRGCANLESVVMLCNVKTLSMSLFYETGLKTIIIPDSVETIDQQCFDGCTALETVVIGTNVTNIGYKAFARITNLIIHYKGSEENWNTITKDSTWNESSTITVDYNYTGTQS